MSKPPADSSSEPAAAPEPRIVPPLCAVFRRFLKRAGHKFTPERAEILDAVLRREGVFEAEELLMEMRATGSRVSKATIYRTLKHLVEAGIITELLLDPKQSHYQLSYGREPTGHLMCVETREVISFDAPELDAILERVCREHGYEPVSVKVAVYGVSPEARQRDVADESVDEQPPATG